MVRYDFLPLNTWFPVGFQWFPHGFHAASSTNSMVSWWFPYGFHWFLRQMDFSHGKNKRSSVAEQRNLISGFSGRFRSHGPIMVIPKLAHGGRLGSLIGCFGSVFEPSSRCQPGRQLLGALISGPNKSSSGLRFGPNCALTG